MEENRYLNSGMASEKTIKAFTFKVIVTKGKLDQGGNEYYKVYIINDLIPYNNPKKCLVEAHRKELIEDPENYFNMEWAEALVSKKNLKN